MSLRLLAGWLLSAVALSAAVDLDRAMILAPVSGRSAEATALASAQAKAAVAGAGRTDLDRVGWGFVALARRTLDAGCYKLAEKTADVMDRQFGVTPEALLLRGHVDHNLHRFQAAEAIARKLTTLRDQPEDWALLSDALMEQGDLAGAVAALQHGVNLRPGPEANVRIAHLRWLRGDLAGAKAAMVDALRQTSPTDSTSVAWILCRLSGYQLQSGARDQAEALARRALARLPDYPPALLALGRAQLAGPSSAEAKLTLGRAVALNPLPEYQWWWAEACRKAGDLAAADSAERALRVHGAAEDPRTFALFLATRGETLDVAVRLARAELTQRRDVQTHDALAWALYAAGDLPGAQAELKQAMAEGTSDPRLALHAAVLASAAGNIAAAAEESARARASADALLPSEQRQLAQLAATLAANPPRVAAIAAH